MRIDVSKCKAVLCILKSSDFVETVPASFSCSLSVHVEFGYTYARLKLFSHCRQMKGRSYRRVGQSACYTTREPFSSQTGSVGCLPEYETLRASTNDPHGYRPFHIDRNGITCPRSRVPSCCYLGALLVCWRLEFWIAVPRMCRWAAELEQVPPARTESQHRLVALEHASRGVISESQPLDGVGSRKISNGYSSTGRDGGGGGEGQEEKSKTWRTGCEIHRARIRLP